MAIKINSSEITQKKIEFGLCGENKVVIILTKDSSTFVNNSWKLDVTTADKDLSVADLIEICDLIYSEKVLEEEDKIAIDFGEDMATNIYGPNNVESSILRGAKIKLPKRDGK